MGTWGSGLYANDTTCDVRDTYMKYLFDGCSDQDAYEKTITALQEYLNDEDEGPFVWFALAETQWKLGRLLPEVREKALYWIEHEAGMELWSESASKGRGWKRTLLKLKEKLESPMPKHRTVRRPEPVDNNPWNLHDIYAYQLHGKEAIERGIFGKYMVLQKIGEGIRPYGKYVAMRLQVFDHIFDEVPTLEQLKDVRILPLDFPTRVDLNSDPIWMSAIVDAYKKSEYPKKYLTFIGNGVGPENNMINKRCLAWPGVDEGLYYFHELWQGIEYEYLGDGIYHYLPPTAPVATSK